MKSWSVVAGVLLLLFGCVVSASAKGSRCQPARGYSASTWDFKKCEPCKQGKRNWDEKGGCEGKESKGKGSKKKKGSKNVCSPARGYSQYDWDFEHCTPCEKGTRNRDGQGACEGRHDRGCQPARGYSQYDWDFEHCKPCERGTRNRDGKGWLRK